MRRTPLSSRHVDSQNPVGRSDRIPYDPCPTKVSPLFRLRPHRIKIRDEWWEKLLFTIVCFVFCGPLLYFKIRAIDKVEGVLGWAISAVTFGIPVYMIVYVLRDLYRSIRRRSQLIRRWQRYKLQSGKRRTA